MAISAFVIFDVRTGGSDTANGGGFDPSVTAGMLTDGAATSATGNSPVFTSASYNFVAGDVGAHIYIASGTNWLGGWYEIASVAANAATLKAAIGEGKPNVTSQPCYNPSTVAGCATVASPTGATWTIDYSQSDTARFSYTDLASAGTGLTVSSAATPFGKQMVGNMLVIASGTNFNAGNYIIASVSVGLVATVTGPGNITTGAGASGVGGQGGAMATPGKAAGKRVAGNKVFWKNGTYTLSTSTPNIAGGPVSIPGLQGGVSDLNMAVFVGWDTVRTVLNVPTSLPIMNGGAINAITMFETMTSTTYMMFANFVVDGDSNTTISGAIFNAANQKIWNIHAVNTTAVGLDIGGASAQEAWNLTATACSGTAAIRVGNNAAGFLLAFCEAYDNSCSGFVITRPAVFYRCISSGNTGVGFSSTGGGYTAINCVAYGNTSNGYNATAGTDNNILWINCIAESNGAVGWLTAAVKQQAMLINCAGYNNTGGDYNAAQLYNVTGFIAQSAGSFFTDAANDDFSLNSTAGQGALLYSAGFPQMLPRGLTTNFDAIGASQPAANTGPSGGVNPFNGLIVSM